MKSISTLFLGALFAGTTYVTGAGSKIVHAFQLAVESLNLNKAPVTIPFQDLSTNAVSDLVTKAFYFKSLLTSAQQSGTSFTLNVAGLPASNYYAQLIVDGTTSSAKFVKQ